MTKPTAKIHVTKLAAARRQLCAAIRMFFAQEDELATHTVASAAYRVLRDLKTDRGGDEVADVYHASVFYTLRAYHRNKLPDDIKNDPSTLEAVRQLAEILPIDASTKPSDFEVLVPPQLRKEHWQSWNRVSNFLKHADIDPSSHIALDDVDNLFLLMAAVSCYNDVANDRLPEGFVVWAYLNAIKGTQEQVPDKFRKCVSDLAGLDQDQKLRVCKGWLDDIGHVASGRGS